MALTDICITEGDSRISQEENRGNIGVLLDQCIDSDSMVSEIIPAANSVTEVGFSYAS